MIMKHITLPWMALLVIGAVCLALLCACEIPGLTDNSDDDASNGDNGTPDATEPNETFDAATALNVGGSVTAALAAGFGDDTDCFCVSNPNTSVLDVFHIAFTNRSDVNPLVTINSADKSFIGEVWYPGRSADATYYLHTASPSFYVTVEGKDASTYPAAYHLAVTALEEYDQFEPNNDVNNPAALALDTQHTATLLLGDQDYYHVQDTSSSDVWHLYETAYINDADINPLLRVYDADKSQIDEVWYPGQSADITRRFAMKTGSGDERFLMVSGKDGTGRHGVCDYRLTVTTIGNDSYEPDDTFADARPVSSFPATFAGSVVVEAASDNDGDWEWYRITVAAGRRVEFAIDPSAANTELHFHLYESDQSYTGSSLDGTDGETLNYFLNNPTQTDAELYLRLGAFVGDNGDYEISFSEGPAT